MTTSYFYQQVEKTAQNSTFLEQIETYSGRERKQIYVVDSPLGDARYNYNYRGGLVLVAPDHQITFVQLSGHDDDFKTYVDDFVEDLGSISDKFKYKDKIGRPRHWRSLLNMRHVDEINDIEKLLRETELPSGNEKRKCELLISLITGSINDLESVGTEVPESLLDKIKQKIILFDGDQTRFIYQKPEKKRITIQGLSGTGKTELLLHKLKELYVETNDTKLAFTCHNQILANSLRARVPEFFNFMRVEEQIAWNERLWCVHAWGSQYKPHSGIYSYICNFYGLPFHPYSRLNTFDRVCATAIELISKQRPSKHAFDYMLIDESQDFPESFFALCELVTKETVYVAGDIFQSIFDDKVITEIKPDFLLSKCYRTDPRTLMFAHALGMGLFETPKLRWLEDDEWRACGYNVEKQGNAGEYELTREPLRRFEDLNDENFSSIELVKTSKELDETAEVKILEIVEEIIQNHPTVTPDDIGVIFIENTKNTYSSADKLEFSIPKQFGWTINKAYESKSRTQDELLVSNRNNVKGLEFPFVICVTKKIRDSRSYRNALYMMLTRSFLKSYLLTSLDANSELLEEVEPGLQEIEDRAVLRVTPPTDEEKKSISTAINLSEENVSFYDFVDDIFEEIGVLPLLRERLFAIVKNAVGEEFDRARVYEVAEFNYEHMHTENK